ncbi:protein MpOMT13 [Marchantia polymorpha subsp. ruderalis]|nr:hypothetical protein MARPO_0040s0105 [Marchantia polymorpha]BBN03142.1 hypothetical protein Mp_2g21090 [Marchantia polymorpha subsp. ruderalis]|eukprot:PTQ40434.1 hypothetical protein MARPO_0040s0105 [Marchantia polymorpha]
MTAEECSGDEREGRLAALQLAGMCAVPLSLKAAILLGVPEILNEAGPDAKLTSEEISKLIVSPGGTSADAENLDRLLRVLACHNIVTETCVAACPSNPQATERRYGVTPVLKYLIASNETGMSLSPLFLLRTDSVYTSAFQYLHAPVLDRNAEPFVIANGKKIIDVLETDSRLSELFDTSMAHHTHMWVSMLLETYRGFEGLTSLVDVGGGVGANLAMILSRYPDLRGINFDLPHVVAKGIQSPRLEHVAGDFFQSVPRGDAVWMKWILHCWSDESCVKILKSVNRALPPRGKLINMDSVLPETSDSSVETQINVCADMLMMAANKGGKQRTLTQFRKLAQDAGFSSVHLVATVDTLSVLEFHKG